MGRIEDAISKLHAAQRGAAAPPPILRLGTPAVQQGKSQHVYGGKLINVDSQALRRQGMLAADRDDRRLQEQYRAVKRPLIENANAARDPKIKNGNLLMVCSAVPGEGKTFTSINLCLSLARERDWSVVLVDGDCAKPHISRMFGAEEEPGLLDLLRDPSRGFESVVMPTDIPGFSVLPTGGSDEHAAELLASRNMAELCARLSQEDPHRMIVFDSSPLLAATESSVIASQVGQLLIVVRANSTPQQSVTAALEALDASKPIGLVLNQQYGGSNTAQSEYGNYGS